MIRKQEFLIPVGTLLRSLTGSSDRQIYNSITQGNTDSEFSDRLEVMLRTERNLGYET